MWQLFAVLDLLKKLNIIHRDIIKPTNLLVNPITGRLTIADFGSAICLARYINRYRRNYTGNRFYRPPELILGAARYDCLLEFLPTNVAPIQIEDDDASEELNAILAKARLLKNSEKMVKKELFLRMFKFTTQ
ncbi:unnamed protein product [Meloidogyne enterolobii]|uniref:Uncharacterized protein n=1 Tax=Meloidogyne enterolobii TaxID=390850 RepID=A0ACB1BAM6_MELEN